jgi:hypothetical protein
MDPADALSELLEAGRSATADVASLREASRAFAILVGGSVPDGARKEMNGVGYAVEQVTWPVSRFEDGAEAFHSPRPKPALTRGDALLADVREDYWDGWATYRPVGAKVGRWRRFRMGSPGDRGYDLHLATDEEIEAFAREAVSVLEAFGLSQGGSK